MNTTIIRVTIDQFVSLVRHFHPKDTRTNRTLGHVIYSTARRIEPTIQKLGKKPSIFNGVNGLPKSSEELEMTRDTYRELCARAEQDGFGLYDVIEDPELRARLRISKAQAEAGQTLSLDEVAARLF